MADRDWDLGAVVRSWVPTAGASPATSATAPKTEEPNTLACLATLTFQPDEEEENFRSSLFSLPNLVEPRNSGFEELHQLCRPFLSLPDNPKVPSSSADARKADPVSIPRRIGPAPPQNRTVLLQDQSLPPPPLQPMLPHGRQEKLLQMSHQYQPTTSAQPPQTPRARKRKNQQKKNVCHVTAENLSNDPWAWRKYGQKPIKGSPYPRNYYRCSSSKGCAARKQVERSNTEPNMFIVTYTGDHTHPRPTHRNSLAGSTRNKFTGTLQRAAQSAASRPPGDEDNPARNKPASLSPTTPLTAPIDDDTAAGRGRVTAEAPTRSDSAEDAMMSDGEDADLDDEDLLIPNIANNMSDDIFMGLHELLNDDNSNKNSYGFGQRSGKSSSSQRGINQT